MKPSSDQVASVGPKEKAEILLRAALAKKGFNPVLIRLAGLTPLADYFLILSGRSARHVKAVAEFILEESRPLKIRPLSSEGIAQGNWALLDYGDVIVHVFQEPVREFYDLEGLWAEAPREEFDRELAEAIREAQEDQEDDEDWDDV